MQKDSRPTAAMDSKQRLRKKPRNTEANNIITSTHLKKLEDELMGSSEMSSLVLMQTIYNECHRRISSDASLREIQAECNLITEELLALMLYSYDLRFTSNY